jgi:hypothetical protein
VIEQPANGLPPFPPKAIAFTMMGIYLLRDYPVMVHKKG